MKVYVVMRGAYSDREVIAVRTEEKRAKILARYYDGWYEEFNTEDLSEYEDRKLLWCVQFNGDRISDVSKEDPRWYSENDSFSDNIYVRAKTEEDAIKEATKRQKEILAGIGEEYG